MLDGTDVSPVGRQALSSPDFLSRKGAGFSSKSKHLKFPGPELITAFLKRPRPSCSVSCLPTHASAASIASILFLSIMGVPSTQASNAVLYLTYGAFL